MSEFITDGKGRGNIAGVDSKNQLLVKAESSSLLLSQVLEGESFSFGSGNVELTTDGTSFVVYIKNNRNRDLVLDSIVVNLGNSTGGSGDITIAAQINPTAGTIISAGTAALPFNNNLGSSKTFTGDYNIGAEGKTATGGTPSTLVVASTSRYVFSNTLVLPRGASIATSIKPPSGNTSMFVSVAYLTYYLSE
jgi:hypothetical protein